MNEQLLFDTALKHIREQRVPSFDENGCCAYRSPEGLGCAFAPAIKIYVPEMENIGAGSLLISKLFNSYIKPEFRQVDKWFATSLQKAHDRAAVEDELPFLEAFESNMKQVAKDWNLYYE